MTNILQSSKEATSNYAKPKAIKDIYTAGFSGKKVTLEDVRNKEKHQNVRFTRILQKNAEPK